LIELGPEVCGDLDKGTSREWLETNGLGGFASSTVPGLHTRRYHALLIAALRPPVERVVLLSRADETLVVGDERFELSCSRYPGTVHPQGYQFLQGFRLDPFPVWTYQAGGVTLEKSLFMVHGQDTVVLRYRILDAPADTPLALEIRPLVAFRDYHSLAHENEALSPDFAMTEGAVVLRPYPHLPALHLGHDAERVEREGYWYRSFEYAEERARGLDFVEDLFNPLVLHYPLAPGHGATLIASTAPHAATDAEVLRQAEVDRRAALAASAPVDEPLIRDLTVAADQFVTARGDGATIIAGYPWFTDWGRDTMIALPGLTLVTGRHAAAHSILREFARHVNQGLIPNRFPDAGETSEYNTVDATLWFFQAVNALGKYTGDYAFIREYLYDELVTLIDWHVRGTRHGIRRTDDGLLTSGEEGFQLTWMDARVGDWVVTPRRGKPVEIQALWYNALRVMEDLATRFEAPQHAAGYQTLADQAKRSFARQFWNPERRCLYDVVDGEERDSSLRPNQILAVSLPHSLLGRERAREVVEVVRQHLLTPYGLRTLSPEDPRYVGIYEGDIWKRDGSYHQGTVWPWLMGPFLTAYVKVNGGSAKSRQQAREWLKPFRRHLSEAGLGSVSEILDADAPHCPRGCYAQAWSVAELLRAAVEDVYGIRPGSVAER